MEATEKILEILHKARKPLKSIEIAALSHVPKSEVEITIKALKKEGKIVSPTRCYYKISS